MRKADDRSQMAEVRWQKSDGRGQMEVGSRKWEVGMRKYKTEGIGCGLRPVGAIGAYAPEGSGNAEIYGYGHGMRISFNP